MSELKSPLFLLSIALFVLHQVLQLCLRIHTPLIDDYLDNLLAMPIILTLFHIECKYLFKRGADFQLPLSWIWTATIYVCIVSEIFFPALSSRFTFEWLDLIFFFAGAALYVWAEKTRSSLEHRP
jgi:hypothetical protein